MTDWIEWQGDGWPPGSNDTLVEVQFRTGHTATGQWRDFLWQHSKSIIQAHTDSDIIAYRIISEEAKPDAVNHPLHFPEDEFGIVNFIRGKLGSEGFRAYCLGNAIKYVMSVHGEWEDLVEDLENAKVYLELAINDITDCSNNQ